MNLANLAISDISGHWAHSWCSVCLIPDTAEVGNLPINRQEVAWPSDVDRYGDPPDPRGMGDVAIGGWRKVIQLRETRSVWVALMRMFQIEGCQACGLRCNCMPIYIYIYYMPILILGSVVLVHCRKVSVWTPCASIRFWLRSYGRSRNIFDSMVRQVSNDTTWVSTETWYTRAT